MTEIVPERWTTQVIVRRETFGPNSVAGFSDVFAHHELIAALRLALAVNLPVIVRRASINSVNMLHEGGYHSDARLRDLGRLHLPALLAFQLSLEAA